MISSFAMAAVNVSKALVEHEILPDVVDVAPVNVIEVTELFC